MIASMRRALITFMSHSTGAVGHHHRVVFLNWPTTSDDLEKVILTCEKEVNKPIVITSLSWLEPE